MTNLENFINMHRNEFDVYQPGSEVWAGIASGLTASAAIPKPGKFFGLGPKTLLLAAVTSSMLALGVWAYQPGKRPQTHVTPATQSEQAKEDPAKPPLVIDQAIVPGNGMRDPRYAPPVTGDPADSSDLRSDIPAGEGQPGPQMETPVASGNDIPPGLSVTVNSDSSYAGIKTLKLKSFGHNFKIKRSASGMTQVRVLKPGKVIVKDKGQSYEAVLKIEQLGSELVFCYENQDKGNGWGVSYETVSAGEIEVLVPDREISKITAVSSNIDLEDYTASVLCIQTVSGNLRMSEVKGDLDVTTTSGDQDLADITGTLHSSSVSGKVSLKKQHGDVKIKTSSGKISISGCQGNMLCQSIAGNIRLDNAQGRLDLATTSGNISGESISLAESCSLKSISGNINLGLKNSASDLRFDLASISGELRIKKETIAAEGKKLLRTGSGKIPVTAETSSGDQAYW